MLRFVTMVQCLVLAMSIAQQIAAQQPTRLTFSTQQQSAGTGVHDYTAEKSQLMTKEILLAGLEPEIASRIQNAAANKSLGDSLGWTFEGISKSIGMSEQEAVAGNRLLLTRLERRQESLETCRFALTQGSLPIQQKDIDNAIRSLRDAETEVEAELNSALEEVLRPESVDRLIRQLIKKNRVEFASIMLVSDKLKLDKSQITAFARASEMLREALFQRLREGKPDPGDLTKEPKIEEYLLKAENTLSPTQFEVFAQSVGIVPPNTTLKDFFEKSDSRTRNSLSRRYSTFKTIAKNLTEAGS